MAFHPFKGRMSRYLKEYGDDPAQKVLTFQGVDLIREDIDSLAPNEWLTDNVIAFWEEWLKQEVLVKKYPKARIELMNPSMAFMLQMTPDPTTLKTALPDLTGVTHIFLPVNDCRNVDNVGGSHWSLLLVSAIDGVAFHYDSLESINEDEAQTLAHKMSILLGQKLRFIDLIDAPQQQNNCDCGIFVCLNMAYLLKHRLLQADTNGKVSMSMSDKHVHPKEGRKEIQSLLLKLMKGEDKKTKSRSRSRQRSKSPSKHSS